MLLFSNGTFDELQTRLHLPKFDHHVSREGENSATWPSSKRSANGFRSPARKLGCRGPDDDKLLETALMGAADCLVSGDGGLLGMSAFRNIPVLSPTGFLDLRTVR